MSLNPTTIISTIRSILMIVIAKSIKLIVVAMRRSNMMMEGWEKLHLNEDSKEL